MAKSSGFDGGLIHFGPVRLRVNGGGNLKLTLRSLDSIRNSDLPDIVMAGATNREPVSLANFTEQRAQLEIRTETSGDSFIISRIIIFVKPTATGYPQ